MNLGHRSISNRQQVYANNLNASLLALRACSDLDDSLAPCKCFSTRLDPASAHRIIMGPFRFEEQPESKYP